MKTSHESVGDRFDRRESQFEQFSDACCCTPLCTTPSRKSIWSGSSIDVTEELDLASIYLSYKGNRIEECGDPRLRCGFRMKSERYWTRGSGGARRSADWGSGRRSCCSRMRGGATSR